MTGNIKKHLRRQQLKAAGGGSPSSSSGGEEPSSPPSSMQYERSKTTSWTESQPRTRDDPIPAKHRRPPTVERSPSSTLSREHAPVDDLMELRKELAGKAEELHVARVQRREMEQQMQRERDERAEAEAQRAQAAVEASHLQQELHDKTLLLNQHEVFLRKLRTGETVDSAAALDELLEACKLSQRRGDYIGANGDHSVLGETPRAALAAAERENSLYEQEVHRLQKQVQALQREKAEAKEDADRLWDELERVKKQASVAANGAKSGSGGAWGDEGSFEGAGLKAEVDRLRQELEEVKEDKEATVTELLSQVMALNSKLQSARKEREAAVVAADRKMEVMKRELSSVVERNERNEAEVEKARGSIVKAEEYLKALDVARVEVKRLRLERDLLIDKLRTAEETMRTKGITGTDLASWLMPNCLLQRDADDAPKYVPDTPSR